MKEKQQFEIKDDVDLVFQSNEKLYKLRLVISSGLMFLSQLEKDKISPERIIFIDNTSHYSGEEKPVEEHTEVAEASVKKKRRKKK